MKYLKEMFMKKRNSYLRVYRTKWKDVKPHQINGDEFIELYHILGNNNARDVSDVILFEWYLSMMVIIIDYYRTDPESYMFGNIRDDIWCWLQDPHHGGWETIKDWVKEINEVLNDENK